MKVGVRTIVCPPAAGVASAYGLLVAPARADRSRTVTFAPASDPLNELEREFTTLEAQALSSLDSLSQSFGPVRLARYAEGRFTGRGFNLSARLPDGPYVNAHVGEHGEPAMRASLIDAFLAGYREKFGRTPPDVPVELVNLRVTGEAPPRTTFAPKGLAVSRWLHPKATRKVYFRESHAYLDTPIFDRSSIGTGFTAKGPLIIEDPSSSLVVGPRGHVEQLESGKPCSAGSTGSPVQ